MTRSAAGDNVEDFLLGRMGDEQREAFEGLMLTDEELYFRVVDAENDMVDAYARGAMSSAERRAFEATFERVPSRRERVANARVLNTYIRAERAEEAPAEGVGFFARLRSLFASPFAAPAYAMAGLIVAMAVGMAVLYSANRDRESQIARLEAQVRDGGVGSPEEAERRLAESQRRIDELQAAVDDQRGATGDLSADLAREREYRRRLEREVAALRQPGKTGAEVKPPADPSVAVLDLGGVTATNADAPEMAAASAAERLSFLITLPSAIGQNERVSIRLNGAEIASGVAVRRNKAGAAFVNAVVARSRLSAGTNTITVHDASGAAVAEHKLEGIGR